MEVKYVYTIESGEYSDHTVHAVYSTKEAAEAQVKKLVSHDKRTGFSYLGPYTVCRLPLDTDLADLRDRVKYVSVRMFKDGSLTGTPRLNPTSGYDPTEYLGTKTRAFWWAWGRDKGCLDVTIGEIDADESLIQKTIKTANDVRAQLIATNRWPTKDSKELIL